LKIKESTPEDYGQSEGYRILEDDEIGLQFSGKELHQIEMLDGVGDWWPWWSATHNDSIFRTILSREQLKFKRDSINVL
jgi:hypothetical protein